MPRSSSRGDPEESRSSPPRRTSGVLEQTYRDSLSLLTDLYQITMAYGHWRSGVAGKEAVFNLFFRSLPFGGGYAIACGLASALEYLERYRFGDCDLEYLRTLTGSDGSPLFEPGFLNHLRELRFTCDVDMIPEGTVVFPQEPLVRVRGPIIEAQLLETALLTLVNFPTLIATKAARICQAAHPDPVLEFGLRRAPGIDGGLTASRAAFVGGCEATSNLLAGKTFGIPVRGTHAHSWVMAFDDEREAFERYAEAMPNNCVLLVDTYDTLDGVRKAVEIGAGLRERGHRFLGIRLDSGDLAYLSIEARKILDGAGFPDAAIVASSELDEHLITSLKQQGAKVVVWGVGNALVTGGGQSALGGVYKLTAVRDPGDEWSWRIKLSEQAAKITTPGFLQVRRYTDGELFTGDMIYDETEPPEGQAVMVDPLDITRRKSFAADARWEELLVPVFRGGRRVYDPPPLEASRARTFAQLEMLHPGTRRLVNPHEYPVGLEQQLHQMKTDLILQQRSSAG